MSGEIYTPVQHPPLHVQLDSLAKEKARLDANVPHHGTNLLEVEEHEELDWTGLVQLFSHDLGDECVTIEN